MDTMHCLLFHIFVIVSHIRIVLCYLVVKRTTIFLLFRKRLYFFTLHQCCMYMWMCSADDLITQQMIPAEAQLYSDHRWMKSWFQFCHCRKHLLCVRSGKGKDACCFCWNTASCLLVYLNVLTPYVNTHVHMLTRMFICLTEAIIVDYNRGLATQLATWAALDQMRQLASWICF